MTDSSGVCLRSHIAARAGAVRSVTREKIAVFAPCELSQLVKVNKIVTLTLIVRLVLVVLKRAEIYLCARREMPKMLCLVIDRTGTRRAVYLIGSVDKL